MTNPERRRISRRTFLLGTGAATIAVGTGLTAYALQTEEPFEGAIINAFVALLPDGRIEVVCPAQNLGQGAPTALSMVVAEEIGADLDQVMVLPAPRDAAKYGNPDFSGRMVTADSKTTAGYWRLLRLAGAESRKAIIATAARSRNWSTTDCSTRTGAVFHTQSGENMTFAEVAAIGRLELPGAGLDDLKNPSAFSLIGTSPLPGDALAVVTGRKQFGTDIRKDETLISVLRRSPHLGGLVRKHDDAAARAIEGVVDVLVLADQSAIAVVATNTWAAMKGANALEVSWSDAVAFSSASQRAELEAMSEAEPAGGVVIRQNGTPAGMEYTARFFAPNLTHVLPEPLNATAEAQSMGLGVRISGSTQSQDLDMRFGARTWKTAPFMVSCIGHPSGGAYGRRVLNDVVRDAAEISKTLGRSVQVIRPQADEMQRGQVRPAAAQFISAKLDDNGALTDWRHSIVSDGTLAAHLPSSLKGANGDEDNTATDGSRHPYRVERESITWTRLSSPASPGFLRGVSAAYTVWAVETSIERMTLAAGFDPLDWRLQNTDDTRLRAVIESVATMANWRDPNRHMGLAAMKFRGARVATIVEVQGRIPTALWIAADVGQVVHRRQVLGQIEGGAIWGLSMALHEQLLFSDGTAQVEGLADYPILRNDELPAINIELLETQGVVPAGVGEIGIPTVIPALCNALESESGQRVDILPIMA